MSMKNVMEALSTGNTRHAVFLLAELSNEEIAGKISDLFDGQTHGVVFATTVMHLAVQLRMGPNPEIGVAIVAVLLDAITKVPTPEDI